jgi:hypothetical protein
LQALAQGLSIVAARLGPKDAAQFAATLVQTMSKNTDLIVLQRPDIFPPDPAMSKNTVLPPLAQGLAALATRLEPEDAAQAAAPLFQAMSKTTDRSVLPYRAQGIAALSARLAPKDAARLCGPTAGMLAQAQAKATHPSELPPLTQGLSAILSRNVIPSRGTTRVAGALAAVGNPAGPLVAPALLRSAFAPLPPPLPVETLVELLKHPLFIGEARRLVLDQLQRHYKRSFADQWDFVAFATERKLDLASPPRRPATVAVPGPPRRGR